MNPPHNNDFSQKLLAEGANWDPHSAELLQDSRGHNKATSRNPHYVLGLFCLFLRFLVQESFQRQSVSRIELWIPLISQVYGKTKENIGRIADLLRVLGFLGVARAF